jgi:hypothetical protein
MGIEAKLSLKLFARITIYILPILISLFGQNSAGGFICVRGLFKTSATDEPDRCHSLL